MGYAVYSRVGTMDSPNIEDIVVSLELPSDYPVNELSLVESRIAGVYWVMDKNCEDVGVVIAENV